jgi:predicted nucleic acid-binding protein
VTDAPADPASAVLDTNVVLDWLLFRDPRVTALAAEVEAGRLRWLTTPRMRSEFDAVLARGHLDRWAPDRERLLTAFDRFSLVDAEAPPCRLVCTDGDDQGFIDLAVHRRCRWLVTHDRALLKLASRARAYGVQVLPPARWAP